MLESHTYDDLLRPEVIQAKSPKKGGISLPAAFNAELNIPRKKSASTAGTGQKADQEHLEELKVKKAWEIALGPAKSIPMNLIMSYMTGNSLQIIPIMMTFMLFWNPLKAIFTETNAIFKNLETKKNSGDILLTKAIYVICQVGCMAVGIWKLYKMGLIPNSEGDWLAWKVPVQYRENAILI